MNIEQTEMRAREPNSQAPAVIPETIQLAGKISLDDIVLITKHSKLEYDMLRTKLSYSDMLKSYADDGFDPKRVLDSHERQIHAKARFAEKINPEQIVSWDAEPDLLNQKIANAKLVVALGGDNHFQRVSHLVHGKQMIAGVNSDIKTSNGNLLSFDTDSFIAFLPKLLKGEYNVEHWNRLKVLVNDKEVGQATCDIFIGERERQYMSRYTIDSAQGHAEHKSSGLLIANGAGSTGWFSSGSRQFFPEGLSFPRDADYARFVTTEISNTGSRDMPYGRIEKDEEFRVSSLNDSDGIIAIDSLENISFPRGARAVVAIDHEKLNVLQPLHKRAFLPQIQALRGKVGILGGTFDPVHVDHIRIAARAKEALGLDAVVFMPTPQNPLKGKPMFSDRQRIQMLEDCLENSSDMYVSDFELQMKEQGKFTGCTIDMLSELEVLKSGQTEYYFLMGIDNFKTIDKWKDYQQLFKMAQICPLERNESFEKVMAEVADNGKLSEAEIAELRKNVVRSDTHLTTSSTEIREKIKQGSVPDDLLPFGVGDYIRRSVKIT